MLFDEFLVTLHAIDAHAEKFHFGLEFTPGIAQVTGLNRAPRGVVLRVKIQNQVEPAKSANFTSWPPP